MEEAVKVQFAYVDESGDSGLDLAKKGSTRFYVITAVLCSNSEREDIEDSVNAIRQSYFQAGAMKSSSIAENAKKRRAILEQLANAGVRFCAVVVDKSRIWKDSGLRYKPTFFKFINSKLLRRLYSNFSQIHVFADRRDDTEFMESFRLYLDREYQKSMFDRSDFTFVDDLHFPLIQAADIISGSLRRLFERSDTDRTREILSRSAIDVDRWPPEAPEVDLARGATSQERFDRLVTSEGWNSAQAFLSSVDVDPDEDSLAQVEALRFLLSQFEMNPGRYTLTNTILKHLNLKRSEPLSEQAFRSRVIGKLRTRGVIIASSAKGYKIPCSAQEMETFVQLVNNHTIPYLKRLGAARTRLSLASVGEYEIVPESSHPDLHRCLRQLGATDLDFLADGDSCTQSGGNEDAGILEMDPADTQ